MYELCNESSQRRKYHSGIDEQKIVGVVILNNTGMKVLIENIPVYIAVDSSRRKRIRKTTDGKAISIGGGKTLFLHVEPDNPARKKKLYEKLGFTQAKCPGNASHKK
jgi:hypothetical protein